MPTAYFTKRGLFGEGTRVYLGSYSGVRIALSQANIEPPNTIFIKDSSSLHRAQISGSIVVSGRVRGLAVVAISIG